MRGGDVVASELHGSGDRSQLRLTCGDVALGTTAATRVGSKANVAVMAAVVGSLITTWHALTLLGRRVLRAERGAELSDAKAEPEEPVDLDASVLDAFLYAGSGGAGAWACAAHTDASALTLVVSDTEHGLECQDRSTGAWVPVPLGRGRCALLVGRAGASAACRHRVRHGTSERTSITLDLY